MRRFGLLVILLLNFLVLSACGDFERYAYRTLAETFTEATGLREQVWVAESKGVITKDQLRRFEIELYSFSDYHAATALGFYHWRTSRTARDEGELRYMLHDLPLMVLEIKNTARGFGLSVDSKRK